MNIHTFKDVVASKRSALANELEDDEDDDREVSAFRNQVEGEEEEGDDKFNEIGEVMEPFNLHDERDRGHFDENMNFVFKKERGEVDAWLATMDEATMEKSIGEAAEAKKKQMVESRNEIEEVYESVTQMKHHLLQLLFPGETVTSALKRLSGRNTNNSSSNRGYKSKAAHTTETTTIQPVNTAANKVALNKLIGYADKLLSAGVLSIYDATYEAIETSLCQWEYRALDGSIQGPYNAQQIVAWMSHGYFTGDSSVYMRKVHKNTEFQIMNHHSGNIITATATSVSATTSATTASSGMMKRKTENDVDDDGVNVHNKKIKVSVDNDDLLADLNDDDDDDHDSMIKASITEGRIEKQLQQQNQQQYVLQQSGWLLSDDIDFSLASNHNNNNDASAVSFNEEMNKIAERSNTSSSSSTNSHNNNNNRNGTAQSKLQQQQQGKLQLLQQVSGGQKTMYNDDDDGEEEDEAEVDEEIEEQEGSLNKRRVRFKLGAAATREADEDDASDSE